MQLGESGVGAPSPPGMPPLFELGEMQRQPRPLRENEAKRLQELEEQLAEFVAANEARTPEEKRAARKRADRWRAEFDRRCPSRDEIERRKRRLAATLHIDGGRRRDAYFAAVREREHAPVCRPRSVRRQPRRHYSTPRRARAPGRPGPDEDAESDAVDARRRV